MYQQNIMFYFIDKCNYAEENKCDKQICVEAH